MKTKQTLRIIVRNGDPISGTPWLTEHFRYMGFVRVLDEDDVRLVIEIAPPRGVQADVWLKQNHDRLASFGVDVAICPTWVGNSSLNPATEMRR